MKAQSEPIIDEAVQPKPKSVSLEIDSVSLQLKGINILQDVSFTLREQGITTLIGPSGAGKSSLLHCVNGLQTQWQGEIRILGRNIQHWPGSWDKLRRYVGLIGQKPCVFPCSIRANVLFGLSGWRKRRKAKELLRTTLTQAALWDEVKDRLDASAESLSLGQQQRLCIARALAVQPGLLLLDEPTASLDPRSKQLIEQSLKQLAETMPVLCVTHDLEQARRLGGDVVFICEGRLVEQGESEAFFAQPQRLESREFLRWNVCECD